VTEQQPEPIEQLKQALNNLTDASDELAQVLPQLLIDLTARVAVLETRVSGLSNLINLSDHLARNRESP